MPLVIVANVGQVPAPQFVPPETVAQRAQAGGSPNAALALAYTYPIISIDQRQLSYRQRMGPPGAEFSFDTGTLTLTLRQEMSVSDALSMCARQKWVAHENGHVQDNQGVMGQMDAAIRADPTLRTIFITQQWYPRASFAATQQTIQTTVGDIFRRLTGQAVAARDTRTEYMQVHRDVLRNCPEPYIYEVNWGDTLSGIADFFYGQAGAWLAIHRANQGVIDRNPDLIRPGQRLTIPPTP
jgi:hypothetical protein